MKKYSIIYYDVLNELSIDEQNTITTALNSVNYTDYKQIGSKQAWVITIYDNNYNIIYKILQSYNTLVALIDNSNNIYCSGYYSNTTARHISDFAKTVNKTYQDFKKVM